jgi:hypothetical protein
LVQASGITSAANRRICSADSCSRTRLTVSNRCPAANSAMIPAQAAGVVRIGWAPGPERGRPVV